jgi:hypothetical protein
MGAITELHWVIPPEFVPAEHFPGSAREGGDRNVEVSPGGALRLVNA